MKKILCFVLISVILSTTASAADFYTVEPPSAGIFGTPTSVQTVYVNGTPSKQIVDVSKNSALIPPSFGSPTSNLRGTGEPLTPNLASPYTDTATGTVIMGSNNVSNTTGVTVSTNTNTGVNVNTNTSTDINSGIVYDSNGNVVYVPGVLDYRDDEYYEEEAFTKVTSSMYYSGAHLGTLKIPELDLSVKIYEGTTTSVLAKGVGHFKDSSIWNGNVCLAAHNRGTNDYFAEIHELDYGDRITLTTKKGTRTYKVFNIEKISVDDTSNLQGTSDNIITLITCVKNQADKYRWCVQAAETK